MAVSITMGPPPTLTDGVVTLRAHRPDDVAAVCAQAQDPEMQRWTMIPVPYDLHDAEEFVLEKVPGGWLDPHGAKCFAVEAIDPAGDDQPRFAGSVDVRPDGLAGVEIGYGLAAWARGRGVMSRAVRLALSWAFDELGADVALWRANVGNWPSRRVAWACGFRIAPPVAALLEARGERHDGWIGSLARGDAMAPVAPWLDAPTIEGSTVRLRAWQDADLPRIVEANNDPGHRQGLPNAPGDYGPAQAEAFLLDQRTRMSRGEAVGWCIADPTDDHVLGAVMVFGLDRIGDDAEVGYWAHPDARGQGRTTSAVRLAVRHAVVPIADGGLGRSRLTLRTLADNAASRRLAERVGFREIGVLRQVVGGADAVSYDLLADEAQLS